jgi:hypothetical protein
LVLIFRMSDSFGTVRIAWLFFLYNSQSNLK